MGNHIPEGCRRVRIGIILGIISAFFLTGTVLSSVVLTFSDPGTMAETMNRMLTALLRVADLFSILTILNGLIEMGPLNPEFTRCRRWLLWRLLFSVLQEAAELGLQVVDTRIMNQEVLGLVSASLTLSALLINAAELVTRGVSWLMLMKGCAALLTSVGASDNETRSFLNTGRSCAICAAGYVVCMVLIYVSVFGAYLVSGSLSEPSSAQGWGRLLLVILAPAFFFAVMRLVVQFRLAGRMRQMEAMMRQLML